MHGERRAKDMELIVTTVQLRVDVAPNEHEVGGTSRVGATIRFVVRVVAGAKADDVPVGRARHREGAKGFELPLLAVVAERRRRLAEGVAKDFSTPKLNKRRRYVHPKTHKIVKWETS